MGGWLITGIIYGTIILIVVTISLIDNIKKNNTEKEKAILAQQQLIFDEKELFTKSFRVKETRQMMEK